MKIPLLGQTGQHEDELSYQLTQNWYPHIDPEAKGEISLLPTPGLTLFTTLPEGVIRGAIDYDGTYYCIANNKFYEINSGGQYIERGTLNTSNGRCGLAHNGANNGQQIMIVDGVNGYIYDSSTTTLTAIADADYPDTATHVIFIDSYFVVNDPSNTGRFHKSASYDGTSWDALEFATAEQSSDELKAIISSNSERIYLIGERVTEVWYNAGNPDFPFTPVKNGYMPYGTPSPYAVAEIDGMILFIHQNKDGKSSLIAVNGIQPRIASNLSIARMIDGYTLENAWAWTYSYQQHSFYAVTFPTDRKTLVYDITTDQWHEMSSKDTGYHRSSTHTYVYGKHLIGDPQSPYIYEMDWNNYTDNGDTITRIRRSRHIHNGDRSIRHYALMLDCKVGEGLGFDDLEETLSTGTISAPASSVIFDATATFQTDGVQTGDIAENVTTGQSVIIQSVASETLVVLTASDIFSDIGDIYRIYRVIGTIESVPPKIMMRYRDNNGSWSVEKTRSLGKMGAYNQKVVWRRLGRSKDRVYELKVTDPVDIVLIDGYAHVGGDSRVIG